MGGSVRFIGVLSFPSARHLARGLDTFEAHYVRKDDYRPLFGPLSLMREGNTLTIRFDAGAPANAFDATERALEALARTADSGEIYGFFEGQPYATICALGLPAEGPAHSHWDLIDALHRQDAAGVQALLAAGVPADTRLENSHTNLLQLACRTGNPTLAALLLANGADPATTTFSHAFSVPVAALLSEHGHAPRDSAEALHPLARAGQEDVVLWLLAQGCPLAEPHRLLRTAATKGQRRLTGHVLDHTDHSVLDLPALRTWPIQDPVCRALIGVD